MPPPPALLLVDLQRDFFRDPRMEAQRARIEAAAAELLAAFRARGAPVLHLLTSHRADPADWPNILRRRNEPTAIAGTPGREPLDAVRPLADEPVLWKRRYSGFFGTDLAERLRALRPAYLVIAGVNTHACIRMTALDAYQHDHDAAIARDAVGSWDAEHARVTLDYLEDRAGRVLSNPDLLRLLASGRGLWEF